jgi:hypothetical protein
LNVRKSLTIWKKIGITKKREIKMDPDRWKSVAVPIKTWDMLKELSEDNDRSIGGQISFLTKQEYMWKKSQTNSIDKQKARV